MSKKNVLPTTENAVLQWVEALTSRGLTHYTVSAYTRDIKHLLVRYPLDTPSAYESNHLHFALAKLYESGLQPRSLARVLSAWRNFFNWYSDRYKTGYNPCLGVRPPHGHYPDPKILSIEQTEALLNTPADPNDPIALRDQAIFELLYSSGLRLGEIIALDVAPFDESNYRSSCWVDLVDNEVQLQSKEHRQRTVPIGSKAVEAIQSWLALRPQLLSVELLQDPSQDMNRFAALFLGARGHRISPRVIQKQLQLQAQRLGINKAVFPHRLRNSFANHILESSNDVRGVQQLLGHANISSTQSLSQLNPEQLAQFMQVHPRHKKTDS